MPPRLLTISSQELRSHLRKTQATAAIIVAEGRVQAVAGGLSPAGFQAATVALRRYWSGAGLADLNRLVGLPLDDQFHYLTAKALPDGMGLLGLVFPSQTPPEILRKDAARVIRSLLKGVENLSSSSGLMEQNLQKSTKRSTSMKAGAVPSARPVEITKMALQEEDRALTPERDGPPPENKPSKPSHNDWEHISPQSIEGGIIQGASWQPLAEVVHQEEDLVSILQEDFETGGSNSAGREWEPAPKSSSYQTSTVVQSQVDTQPVKINPALENWTVGVEIPVASAITFYLAPRQTKHFLIGGLSRQLRTWMPELCQTYGWELDLLSIRPDYLKWTLRDFPESLTRDMLQTVREKTSLWIFRVFPNLKEGADSPDFWSPGYLVDSQNRDFTTRALMAHVAQNRLGGKS